MDEVAVFDLKDNSVKRMERRYADILRMAKPLRYQTRELRADDMGSRAIEAAPEVEEPARRKPGRPRKNAE